MECLQEAMQLVDSAYKYTRDINKQKLLKKSVSPANLMAFSRQPVAETRTASRAAEYMHVAMDLIQQRLLRRPKRSFNATDLLTQAELNTVAQISGCAAQTLPKTCTSDCWTTQYRTFSGECNNLKNPRLGAVNTPFARWLPAQYEDNISMPKGWTPGKLYSGFTLPLVRHISNMILNTTVIPADLQDNHAFVDWGQWIDHDIDFTPQTASVRTFSDGMDCEASCAKKSPCFPIQVPPGDPRINDTNICIPFYRSSPVCGSGELGSLFGEPNTREQINGLTTFIDASMVYGSTPSMALRLRNMSNDLGLLAVNQNYTDDGLALPPFNYQSTNPCPLNHKISKNLSSDGIPCFLAGDGRANEHLALMSLHALFLREHNRLAKVMKLINPQWDGNTTYHEARKIMGAIQQIITYRDYVPRVIGTEAMQKYLPNYTSYNESVDPRISNVFATAAFRFGHVTIQPIMQRLNDDYKENIQYPNILLHFSHFATWRIILEGGIGPVIRGFLASSAKLQTQDHMMNTELRDKLFQVTSAVALDLASLNLQRGRDHALPGYNDWREFCNLSRAHNVSELAAIINNTDLAQRLVSLYGSPDNIDVWLGGLSEPFVENGRVGPLFACLIGLQFAKLRDGDRFWWQNESVFTPEQREALKNVSLSRIICDNTHIQLVPPEAFTFYPNLEGFVNCSKIPEVNLSAWKDYNSDPSICFRNFKARAEITSSAVALSNYLTTTVIHSWFLYLAATLSGTLAFT
ncbi:eosinophil peroxidase-like [Protopterus annectens]|uniref:eosinophil peroxidase-like n=1 Tax=Protopterus annectens TaxID=7888 RepID=UPI001CFABD9F|nr:eosinophil peroxidase-like [Protopterus annectens]